MYKVTQTMQFDGPDGMPRKAEAGDHIRAGDILPGCLETCLRLGKIVPIADAADPKPEPKKPEPKKPEPKKA